MNEVMEKLWLGGKKFIKRDEIKDVLEELDKNYSSTIKYLISRDYIKRIFKGIFYIKSLEEIKLGKNEKSFYKILANGLELKGVENWYLGLETALKMNNLTHEYFFVDTVINDKILRSKPIGIMDRKVKFIKLKPELIFGFNNKGQIRFSDKEKTLLDHIYLYRYRGWKEREIYNEVKDFEDKCSQEKVKKYANKYPKTVQRFLEKWRIVNNS